MHHLKEVFMLLQQNNLLIKKSKCAFALTEIAYLGHVIGYCKYIQSYGVLAIDTTVEERNGLRLISS